MRLRFFLFLFAFWAALVAHADLPTLTIYTYRNFISEYGAGDRVKAAFEKQCACQVNYVALGHSGEILNRLKLEGERAEADLVLGIDDNFIAAAKDTGLFVTSDVDLSRLDLPIDWRDHTFIPYDYGYFAFIYDASKIKQPAIHSMDEFVHQSASLIYADPRTSTPGLGFLLWIKDLYPDHTADIWRAIASHTVTVTKGWSESYQLFLKGQADYVLSYTTSPAYHQMMEDDDRYQALIFDEGHYLQIETAARLKHAKHPELAEQFMQFMLSKDFQSIIPDSNWAYPVIDIALPAAFESLDVPKKALLFPSEQIDAIRKPAIIEWRNALL